MRVLLYTEGLRYVGKTGLEACACKQQMIIRDIPVFEDWLKNGYRI